jgi:hypothetical protein
VKGYRVNSAKELLPLLKKVLDEPGPKLVEVRVWSTLFEVFMSAFIWPDLMDYNQKRGTSGPSWFFLLNCPQKVYKT